MDYGPQRLPQIPYVLMFWSDPALICVPCNFYRYSCTPGGAYRYFVCLQEIVSALGGLHVSSLCKNTRGKINTHTTIYGVSVCECVFQQRWYIALNLMLCHVIRYAWSWLLYAFILYVCFHTHRDAGEDEGDLDFSALLKAAKKLEAHLYLFCNTTLTTLTTLWQFSCFSTPITCIYQEEEARKRRNRDRCVGIA